jgi:hypothetical protein
MAEDSLERNEAQVPQSEKSSRFRDFLSNLKRSKSRSPSTNQSTVGTFIEKTGLPFEQLSSELAEEDGVEHLPITIPEGRPDFWREDKGQIADRLRARLEKGITNATTFQEALIDLALLVEESGNDEIISPDVIEDQATGLEYSFGQKADNQGRILSVVAAEPLDTRTVADYDLKREMIRWKHGEDPVLKAELRDADDDQVYESLILPDKKIHAVKERRNGSLLWTRNLISPVEAHGVIERMFQAAVRSPEDQEKAKLAFEKKMDKREDAYLNAVPDPSEEE